MSQNDLAAFSQSVIELVNQNLQQLTDQPDSSNQLREAMSYSLLGGGKRVRPLLCYASALLFDSHALENLAVLAAASAVEMIHAYSLIHDDLPAMDDDDLRRGRPTTHIQFDEATAILAGDALQALAFETLSTAKNINASRKISLVKILAKASGPDGMVGGQMIDLQAVGNHLDLDELVQMHAMKTGALIRASVLMGATAAGCEDKNQLSSLKQYAELIGLAFQIQDDILDCIADTSTLGKQQGADADREKPTYVSLLGLEGARQKLNEAHSQAVSSVQSFNNNSLLVQLADYIVGRTH